MEQILEEIERALNERFFYLALMLSLALPDICGALGNEDGLAKPERYAAWFSSQLPKYQPKLSGLDCYYLRCGMLHQGRAEQAKLKNVYDRVIFALPRPRGNVMHLSTITSGSSKVLEIDLTTFCTDMVSAVRAWLVTESANLLVQRNLGLVVQYRPNGLPPFYVGPPVIS